MREFLNNDLRCVGADVTTWRALQNSDSVISSPFLLSSTRLYITLYAFLLLFPSPVCPLPSPTPSFSHPHPVSRRERESKPLQREVRDLRPRNWREMCRGANPLVPPFLAFVNSIPLSFPCSFPSVLPPLLVEFVSCSPLLLFLPPYRERVCLSWFSGCQVTRPSRIRFYLRRYILYCRQ